MRFHEWLPRGSPAGRPLAGASRDRVRIRSRGPPAGVAAALVGPLATLASHLTDRGRPRTNGRGHWTSSSAPPRVASHDSPLRTYLHKYTLSRSSTRVRARHTHTYSQQTSHIQTRTHPYSLTYMQTLIHPCIHLSHTSQASQDILTRYANSRTYTHTFAHLTGQEHLCDARHYRRRSGANPPREGGVLRVF